jgi:alkaline phosphatase
MNKLSREDNRKLNVENNIDWSTGSHTGEPVPVYAIGKGSEKFNGRMDNTEIKGKILGK